MAATLVFLAMWSSALAQEAVFETDYVRYAIATNGTSQTLTEKTTAHEWLAGGNRPFAAIQKGEKTFPVTGLKRVGDLWHAEFGSSGVQADFRVTQRHHYVVIELAHINGDDVTEVTIMQLQAGCKDNIGALLGVTWNKEFAVNLLGLSDRVNVRAVGNGLVMVFRCAIIYEVGGWSVLGWKPRGRREFGQYREE
jgi:hypothetical protein